MSRTITSRSESSAKHRARPHCSIVLALLVALPGGVACDRAAPPAKPEAKREHAINALRNFEVRALARTDFERLPPFHLGPDPYRVAALSAELSVGLLRGRDAVVVLDRELSVLARAEAPRAPSALAVAGSEVFVAGSSGGVLHGYHWDGAALKPKWRFDVPGHFSLRGLALDPEAKTLYAVDEASDRLLVLNLEREDGEFSAMRELSTCKGPVGLERAGRFLAVNCLIDHRIALYDVARADPAPLAEIAHDGPFWGMALSAREDELLVLAGGVEDHPLDRARKFFGFIDSFVYLYRWADGALSRVLSLNSSAHDVVVPKAMTIESGPNGVTAWISGYASENELSLQLSADLSSPPEVSAHKGVPGRASVAIRGDGARVSANPLFDAWMSDDARGSRRRRAQRANDDHAAALRLGEVLFFTTLMAPENPSHGAHSRFSCETCHFEGYVDGRTHHTGRGEVYATTKPLLGLVNNQPYFSRALDRDLTEVAHNEFRVAGLGSAADPWFSLPISRFPWLEELGITAEQLDPEGLRRALITFLMAFNHEANPRARGQSTFSDEEQQGARLFLDRCERCHAARLSASRPETAIPFVDWTDHVLGRASSLVWASSDYEKTGIEPYVHRRGARVPSLRRLYKKRPYFTDGSAPSLEDLLRGARFSKSGDFYHRAANDPELSAFTDAEVRALKSFVDLL